MIEEKSWLTAKDRARLAEVREHLKQGTNPYSTVSKLTLGDAREKLTPFVPSSKERRKRAIQTDKARRLKFASTLGKHQVIVPCEPDDIPVMGGAGSCGICNGPLDYTTSTYGKVLQRFQERNDVYDNVYQRPNGKMFVVQSIDDKPIPVYRTVRVCPDCKVHLAIILDDPFSTVEVISKTGSTRRVRATSEVEDGSPRAHRSGPWKRWNVL